MASKNINTQTRSAQTTTPKRPSFKAIFTDDQVRKLEAEYNENWGVNRRLTMITLSRSSKQLIDGFGPSIQEDNGETILDIVARLTDYRNHLKAGVEVTDAALARMLMVGEYLARQNDKSVKGGSHD